MRKVLELPRLSGSERDRRWALVRGRMQKRGLDAIVLWGWATMWDFYTANARYLCPVGGNAEFNVLVFPASGEPTCFVQMPTFVEGWRSAQDWVGDIRARGATWADTVAKRITELGLGNGNIGMDGLAGPLDPDGWLPHSVYVRLKELLPQARLVEIGDMLEQVRAIKSAEDTRHANRLAFESPSLEHFRRCVPAHVVPVPPWRFAGYMRRTQLLRVSCSRQATYCARLTSQLAATWQQAPP
jgi:Xaa-Pro dipeptidase